MFEVLLYRVKRPYHLVKTGLLRGLPAQIHFHFPARKLNIYCITGTDGKTTSSTLLYRTLLAAGRKAALVTTVAAYIGKDEIDTGFHVTTPDPRQLQTFLARMVAEGYTDLVLECTSQGIYQYRLWGIAPKLLGVTNITPEHLDYHLKYQWYVQAKALLAKKAGVSIINADDELSFSLLKKELSKSRTKVKTYSSADAIPTTVLKAVRKRFPEAYNQQNARLVYAMSQELELPDKAFITALEQFVGVPGRMQTVADTADLRVIVDFAHTPNALDKALTALQILQGERSKLYGSCRLIAVYGSAGLRDWQKRPAMGRVGATLADLAVFTAEDPRTENVWSILRQMKENLGDLHDKVVTVADREQAIRFAITKLAQPGDLVGIFGKGHEKSMCYGTTEYPWSDQDTATQALAQRKGKHV